MKKMHTDDKNEADDLLPEYEFDYRKAKPNRFAIADSQRIVILEADVAEYFPDSESVNRVLRALIEVLPKAA
jgi:hypothetical protein